MKESLQFWIKSVREDVCAIDIENKIVDLEHWPNRKNQLIDGIKEYIKEIWEN